jgi:hypothetical protein
MFETAVGATGGRRSWKISDNGLQRLRGNLCPADLNVWKEDEMKKVYLWPALFFVLLLVTAILWYADYYGNIKMQDVALDAFKTILGVFLGAWANEIAK